jgi:hypothetical protein
VRFAETFREAEGGPGGGSWSVLSLTEHALGCSAEPIHRLRIASRFRSGRICSKLAQREVELANAGIGTADLKSSELTALECSLWNVLLNRTLRLPPVMWPGRKRGRMMSRAAASAAMAAAILVAAMAAACAQAQPNPSPPANGAASGQSATVDGSAIGGPPTDRSGSVGAAGPSGGHEAADRNSLPECSPGPPYVLRPCVPAK